MWVKRSGMVFVFLTILLTALILRIFYISFGSVYDDVKTVAGGRSSELIVYNSKGIIYDRNIYPLAGGQFTYYYIINPREFDRSKIECLSSITGTDYNNLTNHLKSEKPFVLKSCNELNEEIKGVTAFEGTSRYPEKSVAQHLLGYLDLENKVGLSGIEKAYDDVLSENSSSFTVKYPTDAIQGLISTNHIVPSEFDNDDTTDGIALTIDKQLSLIAEESMDKHFDEGCVIVMNPNNGEILTMSSSPKFDVDNISSYLNSGNGELINKSMVNQSVGSVFKIVVAAAALENGFDEFSYECKGGISIGGRVFNCQNSKKHGDLTMSEAFACSCNSYFIALGQILGYDCIVEMAELLGVDSSIRICKDMYSTSGVIPDNEGIQALANLSIGQGGLLISPLQICRMTAVACNGGFLVNPTVYEGIVKDNAIVNKSDYSYKSQVLSSNVAVTLKNMCIDCVNDGTGASAKPSVGEAGGKTASAQTGKISEDGKEILATYFTGFYPADNPEYVITVFSSDGDSGSKTCAPVFREICEFIAINY